MIFATYKSTKWLLLFEDFVSHCFSGLQLVFQMHDPCSVQSPSDYVANSKDHK